MTDAVFCIIALFFIGWVIYLKWQIADLNRRVEKLARQLRRYVKDANQDIETEKDKPVWGQRPTWMR